MPRERFTPAPKSERKTDEKLEAVVTDLREVLRKHGITSMFPVMDALIVEFEGDDNQYELNSVNYGSIETKEKS